MKKPPALFLRKGAVFPIELILTDGAALQRPSFLLHVRIRFLWQHCSWIAGSNGKARSRRDWETEEGELPTVASKPVGIGSIRPRFNGSQTLLEPFGPRVEVEPNRTKGKKRGGVRADRYRTCFRRIRNRSSFLFPCSLIIRLG